MLVLLLTFWLLNLSVKRLFLRRLTQWCLVFFVLFIVKGRDYFFYWIYLYTCGRGLRVVWRFNINVVEYHISRLYAFPYCLMFFFYVSIVLAVIDVRVICTRMLREGTPEASRCNLYSYGRILALADAAQLYTEAAFARRSAWNVNVSAAKWWAFKRQKVKAVSCHSCERERSATQHSCPNFSRINSVLYQRSKRRETGATLLKCWSVMDGREVSSWWILISPAASSALMSLSLNTPRCIAATSARLRCRTQRLLSSSSWLFIVFVWGVFILAIPPPPVMQHVEMCLHGWMHDVCVCERSFKNTF